MIDWLTQLLRCNRGINLRTTTQLRHSLQRHIHDNAPHGTLRADMTSSIKLEVHHVSQRRRNRNEPRPWVTMLNNLVKIGRVVLCYLFCRVLVFFSTEPRDWLGRTSPNDLFCVEWDIKPCNSGDMTAGKHTDTNKTQTDRHAHQILRSRNDDDDRWQEVVSITDKTLTLTIWGWTFIKKEATERRYNFPPHLISVSALPWKNGNTDSVCVCVRDHDTDLRSFCEWTSCCWMYLAR